MGGGVGSESGRETEQDEMGGSNLGLTGWGIGMKKEGIYGSARDNCILAEVLSQKNGGINYEVMGDGESFAGGEGG